MHLLAVLSTPTAAWEETKEMAERGEFVDYTTAHELIRKHRPGDHQEAEAEAVTATAPVNAAESAQPASEADIFSEEEQEAKWEALVQEAEQQNGTKRLSHKGWLDA